MVRDLGFSTVSSVTESWEAVRQIPDYRNKLGISLFKRLFSRDPKCREVFRFSREEFHREDFFVSQRLRKHAMLFVNMLDRAVQLLGPDMELLTESLHELGEMHNRLGVKASQYYLMGDSLLQSLQEMLDPEVFNEETKKAWSDVYTAMSYDMIRSTEASEEEAPSAHPGRRLSEDNLVLITPAEQQKILSEMIRGEKKKENEAFLSHPGRRCSGDSLAAPRTCTASCADK